MNRILGIVAFAIALVMGWFFMRGGGSAQQGATTDKSGKMPASAPVSVRTAAAVSALLDDSVEVTGTIVARHEINIASKVNGKVREVLADEGQSVGAKRLLVRLEDSDIGAQVRQSRANVAIARTRLNQARQAALQMAMVKLEQSKDTLSMTKPHVDAQVHQAEASLSQDEAKLKQAQTEAAATRIDTAQTIAKSQAGLNSVKMRLAMLKAGGREEERQQAAARVRGAQANYEEAKRNAERIATLFKEGAVAQSDIDLAETRLTNAKADLDSALQQQTIVNKGARQEELDIATNQVKEAEAQLALALNGERRIDLAEQNVKAMEEQVRHSRAGVAMARAELTQVPLRESDVKSASAMVRQSEEEIAALQAAVQAAQANLDWLMTNYNATFIKAPLPGRLAHRTVEPGEIVSPGKTLFVLVSDNTVFFEGQVPERDVPHISIGKDVSIRVDALTGKQFRGTVTEVLPAGDVHSRYFTVKIGLPNPRGELKQGMFARGRIVTRKIHNAVMVPSEAVLSSGTENEIVVAKNGTAERRKVVVGIRKQERVQIVEGLAPGESVIVSGQDQLRTGDPVTVVDAVDKVDTKEKAEAKGKVEG